MRPADEIDLAHLNSHFFSRYAVYEKTVSSLTRIREFSGIALGGISSSNHKDGRSGK
jgi:hypothetical protein